MPDPAPGSVIQLIEKSTIRCRCGGTYHVTGELVGAPRCPHCGLRPPREDLEALDRHVRIVRDPASCNHAGFSRVRLYGIAICAGCSRPVLPLMPTQEDEIVKLTVIEARQTDRTIEFFRDLPDGRSISAYPLLFGEGCILVGPDDVMATDQWEFPTWLGALEVFVKWDGRGEPAGWIKHNGKRRGDPSAAQFRFHHGATDPRSDSAPCESQGG